ncbi:hypothetical protein EV178_005460 [Coemansia sp. RSA 1646]|nr:hypothetical protein EV178_005460 [Coemansia sp. RSA 1646]
MFSYDSVIAFGLALSITLLVAPIVGASAELAPATDTGVPANNIHVSRCCGGCGGWGGFGLLLASSFTNLLDTNNNTAHYDDGMLYVNNDDGNAVSSNLNIFTTNNIVV